MEKNTQNNQVCFIAESQNNIFLDSSFELITYGRKLAEQANKQLIAIAIGSNFTENELNKLIYFGADNVIVASDKSLLNFSVEPYSNVLKDLSKTYFPDIILASATSNGRTLLPYSAMLLNTGLTADCTELKIDKKTGLLMQTRPAIGGNIMATIKTPDAKPQMATVRPNSIPLPDFNKNRKGDIFYHNVNHLDLSSNMSIESFIPNKDKKCITKSKIVVAVGKGIKKQENLCIINKFAENINAAIGASREVIDRGWMDYSHQIGLSGKTITPELYIGIGISGAIQHLAGMQTSKHIIAINTDPEANIFKIADLGIVGDLFEILPSITEYINNMKKSK
jgi:electron transfer flavoprotein alpha subunit